MSTPVGYCYFNHDVLADETYFLDTHPFGTRVGEKSRWPTWERWISGPWDREATFEENAMERLGGWLEVIPKRPDLNIALSVRRNVLLEGRSTTRIDVEMPTGDQSWHTFTLWIDESRGYLPILRQTVAYRGPAANPKESVFGGVCGAVLDIRKLGSGWWPYHWVVAQAVGNIATLDDFWKARCNLAHEGKVVDVKLVRPPKEVLRVTLPAGDRVGTDYGERRPISIDQPTEVTVDDIPRLLARYFGQPEPRRPSSRGPIIAAIALVLTTLLLSWVGYRWYRRR